MISHVFKFINRYKVRLLQTFTAIHVTLLCCPMAKAEFSSAQPIHHFFNARLLKPGESQISVLGNAKVGVLENLEIGTQGLLLALSGFKLLNLSLKHRMFKGNSFETSFTSHSFLASITENVSSDSEDETGEEENEFATSDSQTTTSFISAFGVVTTHDLTANDFINWGIYDYFIQQSFTSANASIKVHSLSPMIGYDRYLSKEWAFSANLIRPILVAGNIESDVFDIELSSRLFGKVPFALDMTASFLSFTYSGESVNFEFGRVFFPFRQVFGLDSYSLYANVFWRFP